MPSKNLGYEQLYKINVEYDVVYAHHYSQSPHLVYTFKFIIVIGSIEMGDILCIYLKQRYVCAIT